MAQDSNSQPILGIEQRGSADGRVELGDFLIEKKARIKIVARILSIRHYDDLPQSLVAPVDIVVGWGESTDPRLKVKQANRWYYASPRRLLKDDFFSTTANVHLVGVDQNEISKLEKGAVISASGWLVDVRGKRGFLWKTSLTRNDRGGGACEIFLADTIKVSERGAK